MKNLILLMLFAMATQAFAHPYEAKKLSGCVDLIKDRIINTKTNARDFKFALETRHDGFTNFFAFYVESGVQKLDVHWLQSEPCVSAITISMNLFGKKDVAHLSDITCGQDQLFSNPLTLLAGHKNLGQVDILVMVYADKRGDLKAGMSPIQKGSYNSCHWGGGPELDVFPADQNTKVVCSKRGVMPCRLKKKGL